MMRKIRIIASAFVVVFTSLIGVSSAYADEIAEEQQTRIADESADYTNYKATKFGKFGIVLTVANGSFYRNGNDFDVLDPNGEVLEKIESELFVDNGAKATLKITPFGKNTLFIKYEVVANPVFSNENRGFWSCVGKNTVGGFVGGAAAGCLTGIAAGGVGCVPGATLGAAGGAITSGVGSLIWCW